MAMTTTPAWPMCRCERKGSHPRRSHNTTHHFQTYEGTNCMKIIVVGTGFVGLTHAAVCSEYGHEVYAYDVDKQRIAAYQTGEQKLIERYVNEPGLATIIRENIGRYLFFCDDITSF